MSVTYHYDDFHWILYDQTNPSKGSKRQTLNQKLDAFLYVTWSNMSQYDKNCVERALPSIFEHEDASNWSHLWIRQGHGNYWFYIFSNSLDWQVMNRLKGDLIRDLHFQVFTNPKLRACGHE